VLMISSITCFKPSDGRPVAEPSQDMVLGATSSRRSRPTSSRRRSRRRRRAWARWRSSTWGSRPSGSRTIRQCISGRGALGLHHRGAVFHSILPEGIRREGFLNQVMRKRDPVGSWCSTATGEPGSRARCSSSIT